MYGLPTLPYFLQPYAGTKSRTICPACGMPRTFTRYLDRTTGELLPEVFGRCDREVKCGYHSSPYARTVGGSLSYASALMRSNRGSLPSQPTLYQSASPIPILSIPDDVYRGSIGHYECNALARLLRDRLGETVAGELLARFCIGTSTYWPGACVFWLIDQQGRVRGGQVVLYDETGHTIKHPHRHTTWVHTALMQAHRKRGQAIPLWLDEYAKNGTKSPCLFGLPQLDTELPGKPVAIVESAKTAMLATPFFAQYVWLATMGLSYLTAERLEPLRGRRIVLFPDAGAFEQWNLKAKELCRLGFDITVFDALERLATADERTAGLDLADVILRESRQSEKVVDALVR
ncbi:DUF6371 domain-containing protein [Hymenobacter lucidus]|uniref:DUF6371 domain-containing protein n=1 Tax=Hymenobacter lucidus TaxID=2880930 RepID=A0ABS8AMN1_9BACT|nr:DUF6371 domain-containing protein [Hymenobacter lucidus]MCB2407014.1 DUF6371 domain-containing protein [Hymenobacter lucidus]